MRLAILVAAAVLTLAAAAAAAVVVRNLVIRHRERTVREHSRRIAALQKLNETYRCRFHTYRDLRLRRDCRSKAEFDKTALRNVLLECIYKNRESYARYRDALIENEKLYRDYCEEYDRIVNRDRMADNELYAEYPFFRFYEARLCPEYKLRKPLLPQDVTIRVEKRYVSPQGQRIYRDAMLFHYTHMVNCLAESKQIQQIRQDAQVERAAMTESLRYDVMKRDGFKCVLCGATAQDGVKLHVDHIFPVSLGGKTEMSNLRTLCDRCNLGKGAKYDRKGLN